MQTKARNLGLAALLVASSGLASPDRAAAQGVFDPGSGETIVLAGFVAIGVPAMILSADITVLAMAVHYGDRGLPVVHAAFELAWGVGHIAAGTALAVAFAENDADAGFFAFPALGGAIGLVEIVHAIWSMGRSPNGEARPPEDPPSVALAPIRGGALATVSGCWP